MVSPVQRRAPKRRIGATRLGQGVNNSFTDDRRFFMTTKPDRSRCSTRRLATIADMSSSALWTRLRPLITQDGWVRDYSPRGDDHPEVGLSSSSVGGR